MPKWYENAVDFVLSNTLGRVLRPTLYLAERIFARGEHRRTRWQERTINTLVAFGKTNPSNEEIMRAVQSRNPYTLGWVIQYDKDRARRRQAWEALKALDDTQLQGQVGVFGETGKFLKFQVINLISLSAKDRWIAREAEAYSIQEGMRGVYGSPEG